MRRMVAAAAAALALAAPAASEAGTIGGMLFQDPNRNGVRDLGEAPVAGARVLLMGRDGAHLAQVTTAADGSYQFAGLSDGQYVLSAVSGPGLRPSLPFQPSDPPPIPEFPFGRPRYGSTPDLVANLFRAGRRGLAFKHVALGDSIGFGFNFCGSLFGQDGYIEPATQRLREATATAVTTDKQAIPGDETADLLTPGVVPGFGPNDVFYAVDERPGIVSVSIGGNDFLNHDGSDADIAAALVRARQNLQEIASSLTRELPPSALALNSVYDPEEGRDPSFNLWVPIWDQVLREIAWGQVQSGTIAEVHREYAHEEGGMILGQPGLICNDFLGLDGIHPTRTGYDVHEEKLWQAFGGVTLRQGGDRLGVDLGYIRKSREQDPAAFVDVAGNAGEPERALERDGAGALLPSGSAELRLSGFLPAPLPPAELLQVILRVRYRTTAAPIDDHYRFEASVDGTFSPAGDTAATWNTIIPLVAGAGNDDAEILAFPDQPDYVDVAAAIYVGAPVDGQPTLTWDDLASLSVRGVTVPVGEPDPYALEWDAAWIEIHARPAAAAPPAPLADRLVAAIAGPDPAARQAAALGLAARDRERTRRIVTARLAARPDRELAAVLPEVCSAEDEPLIARLARADDSALRGAAVRALACLSASVRLPYLLGASMDTDPGVRRAVARGLRELGARAPDELLLRLTSDADAGVRRLALATIAAGGAARRPELAAALRAALRFDESPAARVEAAAGLLAAGEPAGIDLLLEQAAATPPSRRARRALAGGAPATIAPLTARLGDPDASVRAWAAWALGRAGAVPAEALAPLRGLLDDPDETVRWAAADSLSRLGDREALAALAAWSAPGARGADLARILGRYDDPAALAALAGIAADPEARPTARRVAARALAASDLPEAAVWLSGLAGSEDPPVRRLAESGLARQR